MEYRFLSNIVILFGLLLLVVSAYWSSYVSMIDIWYRSETFAHGFLIIPLVIFLVYRRGVKIDRLFTETSILSLFTLCVVIAFWLVARFVSINVLEQFAVVMIMQATVWVAIGDAATKKILFPLLYLFFSVPFGEFLIPAMQDFTAEFTVTVLRLLEIPVYWEGRYFYLTSGSFEVAEACSGLRYLIASLALGTLYAYINFRSTRARIIFILLSAVVPVIANGLRAVGIVLLVHGTSSEYGVGVDHLIYGWLFFGIVIFMLFWFGRFIPDNKSVLAHPVEPEIKIKTKSLNKEFRLAVTTLIIIFSAPLVSKTWNNLEESMQVQVVVFPERIGAWVLSDEKYEQWNPNYVGYAKIDAAVYVNADRKIKCVLVQYGQDQPGKEIININNAVFDKLEWKRVGEGSVHVNPSKMDYVTELVLNRTNESIKIWFWYNISGKNTINTVLAKLLSVKAKITRTEISSKVYLLGMVEAQSVQKDSNTDLSAFFNYFNNR